MVQRSPRNTSIIDSTEACDSVFAGFLSWCWESWGELVCGLSDLVSSGVLEEGMMTHRDGCLGANERTEPKHHPKIFIPDFWLNICCYKSVRVWVLDLPLHFSSQDIWYWAPSPFLILSLILLDFPSEWKQYRLTTVLKRHLNPFPVISTCGKNTSNKDKLYYNID